MTRRLIVLLATVAMILVSCSSSSLTPSPSVGQASGQPSSQPSATPVVSVAPSDGPLSVAFVTPIPKPTWHGKPFRVRAEASDGSTVTYVAEGVCTVKASTGQVTVDELGDCTIRASVVDADPAVTATQTFTVAKAEPVITFDDSTTRFARPFRYRLAVSVTPEIPLKMVVDRNDPQGTNDDFCVVNSDGVLVFDPRPNASNFPQIPATCVVRVSGTGTKNYDAPKAVSGVITIALADFRVNVAEERTFDYSETNGIAKFPVQEGSGDAFGIEVYSNQDADAAGDNFLCEAQATTPNPAPGGTTRYTATINIQEPPDDAPYDCEMTAQAVPPDYQGGKFTDDFTIHVVP